MGMQVPFPNFISACPKPGLAVLTNANLIEANVKDSPETRWNIYLRTEDRSKDFVVERLHALLLSDSLVPTFPAAAMKLCALAQNESTRMEDVGQVVAADAGLAARCVQIASSIGFAARPIESINQALMLIGLAQVRRVALAVAAIDTFADIGPAVDWQRYWMHNVLVGRLTELVAGTFRKTTGVEYLAGLLHDAGKLIIEQYFPEQSAQIIAQAEARKCGHIDVELELLGISHAQIGAALCESMRVHPHILRAVWYHHDPLAASHTGDAAGDGGFLAASIAIADRLANRAKVGLIDRPAEVVEKSPEWAFLQTLAVPRKIEIDLAFEVERAEKDVRAFLA